MSNLIKHKVYPASELFDLVVDEKNQNNFIVKSMNLKANILKNDIGGFGIYAVSFKHLTDSEKIIYVGKYQGGKGGVHNSPYAGFNGNIVSDRWSKHLSVITMRFNRIGFRPRPYKRLEKHVQEFGLNYDIDFMSQSKQTQFKHDTGCNTSYNRAAFACQLYEFFNSKTGNHKIDIDNILNSFSFHYWRVTENSRFKDLASQISSLSAKPNLEEPETNIINKYKHLLPINEEYNPPTTGPFFHFDPGSLINCDTADFDIFSAHIIAELESFIKKLSS